MIVTEAIKRLPDFIVVGAMKSATSTLYEQLVRQPGIFMCEPKEPNFFSDDKNYRKGIAWYSRLFDGAPGGALLGEASTHYTKLPTYPLTVERMMEHVPNAKLVYVMRHPVDRLISHYMHESSMGIIKCGLGEAISRFPELVDYGRYAYQLLPLLTTYGRHAVLPVFFDRLASAPQQELERIARFIGYSDKPTWNQNVGPANVSSDRIRRFPLYDILIKSAPAARVRRALVPRTWRSWAKKKLTVSERPVLEPQLYKRVESIFDEDLHCLGAWLGIALSCENFKEVTSKFEHSWVDVPLNVAG